MDRSGATPAGLAGLSGCVLLLLFLLLLLLLLRPIVETVHGVNICVIREELNVKFFRSLLATRVLFFFFAIAADALEPCALVLKTPNNEAVNYEVIGCQYHVMYGYLAWHLSNHSHIRYMHLGN